MEPACSSVTQPTAPQPLPSIKVILQYYFSTKLPEVFCKELLKEFYENPTESLNTDVGQRQMYRRTDVFSTQRSVLVYNIAGCKGERRLSLHNLDKEVHKFVCSKSERIVASQSLHKE
jgi:hypothetical protein